MQYFFYFWLAGIIIGFVYECWEFLQSVRLVSSKGSVAFMFLDLCKRGSELVVWPITLVMTILQMFFFKDLLDDLNVVDTTHTKEM